MCLAVIAGKELVNKISADVDIATKRIKVGIVFMFRHLVDVKALWHKVKSLNLVQTTVSCFLRCLPILIGLFDPLF